MEIKTISFSANDQVLTKESGSDNFVSNAVSYVKAEFSLGTGWTRADYNTVNAVWHSVFATISTVLDANNSCMVPVEMLAYNCDVYVNLVGTVVEDDTVSYRLTTEKAKAFAVNKVAEVEGSETTEITPSQFEQFVNEVKAEAESIDNYTYDSEAWAKGTRAGVPVASTDPTYHNNSKYYADQGAALEQEVTDLKSDIEQIEEITKNILPYFSGTKTINGITFAGDGQGKFEFVGTATGAISSSNKFSDVLTLNAGTYTFSCWNIGSSTENINAGLVLSNGTTKWLAANQKTTFTLAESVTAYLGFSISSGAVKNGKFAFQLEEANAQTNYVPHISAVDAVLRDEYNTTNPEIIDNITRIDSLMMSGKIYQHLGYINGNGNFMEEASYFCKYTEKMLVIPGETISYKGHGASSAKSVLWYSDIDTISSSEAVSSRKDYTNLTVPNGVNYAVFISYSPYSYDDIILEVYNPSNAVGEKQRIEKALNANFLFNKKWVACGDSFTHGDFSGYTDEHGNTGANSDAYDRNMAMYKTYPWWIAKRNGMTLINEADNGSTMAISKEHIDDPDNVPITNCNPFSYQRYKDIANDADYITLWFGLNDMSHAYLGAISDNTNETFYGAWNVVLAYLIEHHPYAKIGIIITDGAVQNTTNQNYQQAIREVAEKWGIPYLDIPGNKQVPVMLQGRNTSLNLDPTVVTMRNDAFRVSSTNWHPNLKAHEYQSTFIETWLRTL